MPSLGVAFDQQYALALLEFWNLGTSSVCVCFGGGGAFRGLLWEVVSLGNLRTPPPHRAAGPEEGDLLPLRGISAMNISAYKKTFGPNLGRVTAIVDLSEGGGTCGFQWASQMMLWAE